MNQEDNRDLWKKLYNLLIDNIDDYDSDLHIELIKAIDDFFTFIKLASCEYIIVDIGRYKLVSNEKILNKFDLNLFCENFGESENISLDKYHFYTIASNKSWLERGSIISEISITILELYNFDRDSISIPLTPPTNFKQGKRVLSKKIKN